MILPILSSLSFKMNLWFDFLLQKKYIKRVENKKNVT
jgi:hypothetical protein